MATRPPNRVIQFTAVLFVVLIGIGIIYLNTIPSSVSSGLLILALVALLLFGFRAFGKKAQSTYCVRIENASGETDALESHDKKTIKRYVDAINEALETGD